MADTEQKWSGKIPQKPIDPIGSLQNHWIAIIVIMFSILITGVIGIQIKIKPSYNASALIKVEPVIPKILYGKEEASITSYYNDFMNTQLNIVKSFPVVSKACLLAYICLLLLSLM